MIEVRRVLYMDEATGAKRDAFAGVRSGLAVIIEAAAAAAARHALLEAYRKTRYVASSGETEIVPGVSERNEALPGQMSGAGAHSAAFNTAAEPGVIRSSA